MTTATAQAVADVAAGTILANVVIAASPDRVFKAITSAEIIDWWGSDETYRTTGFTNDLKVGGRWRAEGKGGDGKPFAVQGRYLEIDPPRKLVQTWNADWDVGAETIVTWWLEPTESGTRLTLRHEGFGDRSESCRGHAEGWQRVLAWLAAFSAPAAPSVGNRYFLCRLLAPRPSFPFDMSEEEAAVMGEHVAYWTEHLKAGRAIVFGPVADPKGAWGLGVLRLADEDAVRAIEANDPAIKSGKGFRYEVLPMLDAVVAS